MRFFMTAMTVLVAAVFAAAAKADPAWFPREVLAYAELRQPIMGWFPPELKRVMSELDIEDEMIDRITGPFAGALEDLERIEFVLIDIRADEKLPVKYAAVLHYRVPKTLDWFVEIFMPKAPALPEGMPEPQPGEGDEKADEIPTVRSTYRGHDMLAFEGAPVAIAAGNSRILLASGASGMRELVDAATGDSVAEEMLPANPRFSRWDAETRAGRFMLRAFGDGVSILKTIDQAIGNPEMLGRDGRSAMYTGQWLEWRKISMLSLTVANDNQFTSRLEVVFTSDPAWAPIVQGGTHTGLKYAHPKSAYVMSFSAGDLRSAMDTATNIMLKADADFPTAFPAPKRDASYNQGRDMFGERKQSSDRMLRDMSDVLSQGWQEAARRYAAKHPSLPAEVTSGDLSIATGLTWVAQPLFGFSATEIILGELDAETGRYSGAVTYKHADGSHFTFDLSKARSISITDPVGQSGPLPTDPATGEPMERLAYLDQREREGRGFTVAQALPEFRKVMAIAMGASEAELLSVIGENLIIGGANNEVDALLDGDTFELGYYFIVPIRDGKRAEKMISNFAATELGQEGPFRRRSNGGPVDADAGPWNFSLPGARVFLPESKWDPAIAFTGDALIFATPGLLSGMIEGSKLAGAASRHGLESAKGAMVAHLNPRWFADTTFMRRSKVNRVMPLQGMSDLPMNFAARFESGRVVLEFGLWRPLELERLKMPNQRWVNDAHIIEAVHAACNRILDAKEKETGTRPEAFPSWQSAAELLHREFIEQLRANRKASEGRDGEAETPEARELRERWLADVEESQRDRYNGISTLFADVPMRDAWTLIPSREPNYPDLFRAQTLDLHCRVLAVGREKYGEDYAVLVDVKDSSSARGAENDEYRSWRGYGNEENILLVSAIHYPKVLEAIKAGGGSIPAALLDRSQHMTLTDLEAAVTLGHWWRNNASSSISDVIDRRGRWTFRGGDTFLEHNTGMFRRIGEKLGADEKSDPSGGSDGRREEEGPGEPKPSTPSTSPTDDDKPKAVVRIEGFGHWADLDRNGNVVDSSWAQNLAKKAAEGR